MKENGGNGKMVVKRGGMGGTGGKWGEMGGNGGKWGIVGNCQKHFVGNVKKCVKLAGKGRKIGGTWDILGQVSRFSKPHFPHLSTAWAPFPQVPLMNLASQTSRLENMGFGDWPTLTDWSASADG